MKTYGVENQETLKGYIWHTKQIPQLVNPVESILLRNRELTFDQLARESAWYTPVTLAFTWVRTDRASLIVGSQALPYTGAEGYYAHLYSAEQVVEDEFTQGAKLLATLIRETKHQWKLRKIIEKTLWGEESTITGLTFLNEVIGSQLARLRALAYSYAYEHNKIEVIKANSEYRENTYKAITASGAPVSISMTYEPHQLVCFSYPKPTAFNRKDILLPSQKDEPYIAFQRGLAIATNPLVRTLVHYAH